MKNNYKPTKTNQLDKSLLNQITAKPSNKKPTKSGWKYFASSLLTLSLLLVFYVFYKSTTKTSDLKHPKIVTNHLAEKKTPLKSEVEISSFQGDVILEVSGYAVAVNKSSISSDITGRIKRMYLDIGDSVKQGDVIALLDDREAQINLADKKLNLTNSKLERERALLGYKNKLQRLDRLKELANNNSISKEELDNAKKEFDEASIRKQIVQVNLDLSKNELKSAQIFLEKHTIRVPFDGVVVDVFARKGEAISPSSSGNSSIRTGLIRLIDPTDLYIIVEVPEQYITKISSQHDVMISIPNQGSNEIQDQVKWISPVSSRQRGVIQIGINLPNGINNIVDGMELNVRFINLPKNIVKNK